MASGGVHLVTGFAAGSGRRTLLGGFLAGVASHAVFDVMPHHDYQRLRSHAIDGAVAVTLLGAMWWRRRHAGGSGPAIAGALGAVIPDVEQLPALFGLSNPRRTRFPTHDGMLPHGKAGRATTALLYAAVVSAAWWLAARGTPTGE